MNVSLLLNSLFYRALFQTLGVKFEIVTDHEVCSPDHCRSWYIPPPPPFNCILLGRLHKRSRISRCPPVFFLRHLWQPFTEYIACPFSSMPCHNSTASLPELQPDGVRWLYWVACWIPHSKRCVCWHFRLELLVLTCSRQQPTFWVCLHWDVLICLFQSVVCMVVAVPLSFLNGSPPLVCVCGCGWVGVAGGLDCSCRSTKLYCPFSEHGT